VRRALILLLLSGFTLWTLLGAADAPPHGTIDASRIWDAGSPEKVELTSTPPDPPPLVERDQWIVDLRWDRGAVSLLGLGKVREPAARASSRVMGRFALELYAGPTLIERVRFDFPLLGTPDPADGDWESLPSFTAKLRSRVSVTFPATMLGNRWELRDRATGQRWVLPWPPSEGLSGDAGVLPDAWDAGKTRL